MIQYYDEREIKVRVSGKNKKELITIVMHELDKINDTYNNLKFNKLIPCICKSCKNSREPYFYPLSVLKDFLFNGERRIQCRRKPYTMVNILNLINDVIENKHIFDEIKQNEDSAIINNQNYYAGDSNIGDNIQLNSIIKFLFLDK